VAAILHRQGHYKWLAAVRLQLAGRYNIKTMDYTGNSSKQWILLATAQNNEFHWQQLKTMDGTGNSSK